MNFYESARWENLRLSILRRDGYRCKLSSRYGKNREAEIVHHIFPRDEFPEYQYEPWNLISVTKGEHNKLHNREDNTLTEYGADLLRRTARKNNIAIPDKYQKEIKPKWNRNTRRGSRINGDGINAG